MSGLVAGVGSIIGGVLAARGAQQGAELQAGAATTASENQLKIFQMIQQLMAPYVSLGYGATMPMAQMTGTTEGGNPLTAPLTKPFTPGDLTQTPGYQFTLDQGLNATQNALTSTGLGRSGNAVKAATDYASNLASTTYQQQLSNDLVQKQQIYNMLAGLVQGGQGAAAGTGGAGMQAQTQANALMTGGAAAGAAGITGAANALANSAATSGLLLGSRMA